jgi:DNA polymerase-3 subunit epsilon
MTIQAAMDLNIQWTETTFIALDLETTGRYPLDAEICEMAAVKWRGGQIVDSYQTLIKPSFPMSKEVIAIHNITDEMVVDAPLLSEKISEFHQFISGGVLIAHHAPFDMGFLSWEFERARLLLPERPVVCTSLLSRVVVTDVPNHRLSTLAKHFEVDAGAAHRALDDAKACLGVALKCFEAVGADCTLLKVLETQNRKLQWQNFSIELLMEKESFRHLVRATLDKREVFMAYLGGSKPGQVRRVFPLGIVRNPDGDFLVATEGDEVQTKRYFLDKIGNVRMVADGKF